jgi:hypothetical protein
MTDERHDGEQVASEAPILLCFNIMPSKYSGEWLRTSRTVQYVRWTESFRSVDKDIYHKLFGMDTPINRILDHIV